MIYLINSEKKKNQLKTIAFRVTVREIAIILKVLPTSSVSGFSLTLAILLSSNCFQVVPDFDSAFFSE